MSLLEIFWTFFKINAVTFGGGYTIAPVILDEFNTRRQLISEAKMLDIIAIAQSVPGALAVAVSILTGYHLRGRKGALVAMFASILPPLIVISVLFYFYRAFASNFWVRAMLRGMSGMIGAILLFTCLRLAKTALRHHCFFSSALLILAFTLSLLTNLHTALIILMLASISLLVFNLFEEKQIK